MIAHAALRKRSTPVSAPAFMEHAIDRHSLLRKLFSLLLVLTMQTCYVKMTSFPLSLLLNGCLMLTCFGCLLVERNAPIPRSLLGWTGAWWLLFLSIPACHLIFLPKAAVNYSAMLLITVMCTVLFALCVCYVSITGVGRMLDDLSDAITLITSITLLLYFAGQVFNVIRPTGTVTISWGGTRTVKTYFYLLFVAQGAPYHEFAHGRFTGIFTEAPMCAFMCCTALIIILLISKRRVNWFRVAILLVGVYSTASAMGYIAAIAFIAVYFCLKVAKKRHMRGARILLIASVISVVAIVVLMMYGDKMATDTVSISTRSANFSGAIADFIDSPIYGHGFKSDTLGVTGGNTSVYSNLIQQGGALFLIWYMMPFLLCIFRFIGEKRWRYLAAMALYLMLMYAAVVTYTALSIAVVSACFSVAFQNGRRTQR